MAIPIYARLWWDKHRGRGQAVVFDELELELHEPPHILGDPVEIDYSEVHPDQLLGPPEIRVHDYDQRREMYPPEVRAAHDFLRELSAAIRRLLKIKGTL